MAQSRSTRSLKELSHDATFKLLRATSTAKAGLIYRCVVDDIRSDATVLVAIPEDTYSRGTGGRPKHVDRDLKRKRKKPHGMRLAKSPCPRAGERVVGGCV